MPQRNLLPRLADGNVGSLTVGAWTVINSPGELARLDLGVRDDVEVRTRVQSIPSPWARMLLFRAALGDPRHPARRLVESELLDGLQFLWSAAERPNAPLHFETIRLADLLSAAEGLSSQRAEWWVRALLELQPSRSRESQRAFDAITVVLAGGHPILATSSFTLLFTAEDACNAPREITGPYFRFFVGDEARSLAERPFAFQRYVAQVLLPQLENQSLLRHADSDAHALQSDTKRWIQEEVQRCRRAAGSAKLAQLEAPSNGAWRAAAATLGLNEVGEITGGVRLFARKAGADMEESEWILRSKRRTREAPLVLQPAMFSGRYYPGAPSVTLPTDLEAWDQETLPQTGTRYPWVYPERHWFANQILVLAEPLEAANVHGFANFRSLYTGDKAYLKAPQFTLPLRREVLEFFSPEEIDNRLSIEVQPSGQIEMSLRVPVGPDQRELVIKRRYDETAFFHEVTGPALTLWPRFKSEHWKDYVLFRRDENANVAQFIAARGVVAGEMIEEDAEQRNEVARVSSFEKPPEAIEFTSLITGGATAQRLGLVLPKYGRSNALGPNHWNVGVDFGTSNTVVSIKQGPDQAPVVLRADNMTLPLTKSSAQTLSLLDAYFMPHSLAPKPFGTAAVVFDRLRTLNVHEERIGVRVNVPFNGHVQSDQNNRVTGDLKWSTEPETRFLTQSFLRHVLAVVLAQATERGVDPRHVRVVWSYPRSFMRSQVNQLDATWTAVRQYFADRLGGIGPVERGMDESRAVLQFFANDQEVTTAGDVNVIVDIGGGTSDIAMYGHGRTLVLDSVLLGGRNLTGKRDWAGTAQSQQNAFVAQLVAWAERNSLTDYPIERNAALKYLSDGQDHLAFTYLLQSQWFSRHGAPFSAEGAAHRFQTVVLYMFGALSYYVGVSLRQASARDRERDYTPVAVKLAGNGSQYIRWLTELTHGETGAFERIFGRLILAGMGGAEQRAVPRVSLSNEPKREVALGLVARADIQGIATDLDSRLSIAGESFTAKFGDQRISRAVTAAEPLNGSDILFPDQVAGLVWADDAMEIEAFHTAFVAELQRLADYGPQWTGNAKAFRDLLNELPRREIQQLTRARLQLIASAMQGFQGSLFVVETAAVMARMQDRFFGATRTPAYGVSVEVRG